MQPGSIGVNPGPAGLRASLPIRAWQPIDHVAK
jgi:hypothetical protein